MWRKAWGDPVWSKVIAAAIIGTASIAATFFFGWWPAISNWIAIAFKYLATDSSLPNWAVILLGILALPIIIALMALAWSSVFPTAASAPNCWAVYTSDVFLGLRWRWSYDGSRMSTPNSFCPSCDFQIFPERGFDYGGSHTQIRFHCDNCSTSLGTFNDSYEQLQSKAARFAQMKIRSNSWAASGSS